MPAITKTIGVGGDFLDIGSAWQWILSVSPGPSGQPCQLASDWQLNVISDFVETTGVNAGSPIRYSFFDIAPYFMGFTVTVSNPNGFKTTASGAGSNGFSFIGRDITGYYSTVPGFMVFDGLVFELPAFSSNGVYLGFFGGSYSSLPTVTYKNLKFIGGGSTSGAFFAMACSSVSLLPVNVIALNCLVDNMGGGIEGSVNSAIGQTVKIENCTFHKNSSKGIIITGNVDQAHIDIKNTVCSANTTKDFDVDAFCTLTNCADGDGSIASSPAAKINCKTGITDADFLSILNTDLTFLRIDQSSKLYELGSTVLSIWNTADLFGEPRPHGVHNLVSIGVDEGINSVPSGDYFTTSHDVVFLNGLCQSWAETSSPRVPLIDILNAHTANRNNPHQVGLSQLYPGDLPVFASNALALAGGVSVGSLFRTGADPDTVCVVH